MATETHETISEGFPENFDDWLRRSLLEADSVLPREVIERILAQGEAAVAPLIEILEDRSLLEASGGWAPIHAAVLLGELGAVEAVPALLEALVDEYDGDIFTDEASESLMAMGPDVLEPVLEMHAELLADSSAESANPYYLMDLERILCSLGVQDERVFTTLLGALERTPEHGACCLAQYGDERAIEALSEAFDQCDLEADVWSMDIDSASEIWEAIEELGGSLTEEQQRRYLKARERLMDKVQARSGRDGATTKRDAATAKQKRRAARKQQKASRKKNRR